MKVALVYDRVNKWGGAERILLALHKMFPKAPLYTSIYSKSGAPWANVFDVRTSFLQKFSHRSHEFLAPLMPFAFESFNFDEYDVVISVTSEAAKGIITKPSTLHICLCLTPTRYLWSGYDEYFKNSFIRTFSKPFISYLQNWDKKASKRPDYYIAISETVAKRIKKYYGRKSTVIYPGVGLKLRIKNQELRIKKKGEENQRKKANGYFLLVSRLSRFTPHKRVDIAIDAANRLSFPLKIAGEGDIPYFRKKAGNTIEFLGRLTDEELSYYYKNSTALIFPGIEDFGLVMVEAQSHGTPVIAFAAGGALEIVRPGITGEFFQIQNSLDLMNVLEKFDPKRYNRRTIIKHAAQFSPERFEQEFMKFIREKMKEYFKNPKFEA